MPHPSSEGSSGPTAPSIGSPNAATSDSDLTAENARLVREVAHWRGLYEQLVIDARANITDAEGQIEMARDHIHELVGFIDGARELEARLNLEVAHWRERYEHACEAAEAGAASTRDEIDRARENIRNLVAQVEAAAEAHERLRGDRDRWRLKAERRSGERRAFPMRALDWIRNGGRPAALPRAVARGRRRLSSLYLSGNGIEIGALHTPTPVPKGSSVQYVDRIPTAEQRAAFPELRSFHFVDVDVIDDGETLTSIEDGSLDFLIASHVLEHCENPLGAIRNHADKVRAGGILYYVLPDRRHSFDAPRPVTTFDHLIRDDREGPACSRRAHYLEYARLVDEVSVESIDRAADLMETEGSRIHFHVWDQDTAEDFWRRCERYLENRFRIETVEFNVVESIAILRRTDPDEGEGESSNRSRVP